MDGRREESLADRLQRAVSRAVRARRRANRQRRRNRTPFQLRVAGTDLEGYAEEPFLKTARAKGLHRLRLCRHVFAYSAARLTTVLVSEMLGLVSIGLYAIELITATPGFGTLTIDAAASRHPGLVFAVVLLPAGLIAVTNAARGSYDTLYDPRVETGD